MRTVSSYGVELRKQNIPIRQTLDIYRSAVSCLIEIYAQIWDELAVITEPKKRFNTAEHLVHTTKKNQARFDFDLRFPKMPSYLRRAAISMPWEVYPHIRQGWNCGKKRIRKAAGRSWCVIIMPCRYSTEM